jgi:hypothetical protein
VSVVGLVDSANDGPEDVTAVDFVVEADRGQLTEIAERVRDGRLRTNIGATPSFDEAIEALNSTARLNGKTIINVVP